MKPAVSSVKERVRQSPPITGRGQAADSSRSGAPGERPSAVDACGCKGGCHCSDRGLASGEPGRLVPRVVESMRGLSPLTRPAKLRRPEER
ncbi:MAG: hypothetical protein JST59_29145 [Actinobacteria bacterium]|nr:hypothetical protein [Actinomycetota bacterium]